MKKRNGANSTGRKIDDGDRTVVNRVYAEICHRTVVVDWDWQTRNRCWGRFWGAKDGGVLDGRNGKGERLWWAKLSADKSRQEKRRRKDTPHLCITKGTPNSFEPFVSLVGLSSCNTLFIFWAEEWSPKGEPRVKEVFARGTKQKICGIYWNSRPSKVATINCYSNNRSASHGLFISGR